EIKEVKKFVEIAQRKDAVEARIKKNGKITKLKVRCAKQLYTLVVADAKIAEKIRVTLPSGLKVVEIDAKKN
ncbi:ribosomal protein L38e, partial [Ramicandelaber brevisporus]